jgi:hypothetical protein
LIASLARIQDGLAGMQALVDGRRRATRRSRVSAAGSEAMTDRERVLRRVEEGRATRAAELAAAVSSPVPLAVRLGAVHRDGARVFDP